MGPGPHTHGVDFSRLSASQMCAGSLTLMPGAPNLSLTALTAVLSHLNPNTLLPTSAGSAATSTLTSSGSQPGLQRCPHGLQPNDAGRWFGAQLRLPRHVMHPKPYRPHLTPLPSPLRPHCLAEDRLLQWMAPYWMAPIDCNGKTIKGLARDIVCTPRIINDSIELSMQKMFGLGVVQYIVYADARGLSDA
jgi:hypothetical protein